jgi:hypothetical protein
MATLLAALVLVLQEPPKKEEPKPVFTALVGGDIYTVTKGVVKGGTLLLKDDKIHRVGVALELPEGTTRIDAEGKRILPGFVAAGARGLGVGFGGGGGKIADSVDPFQDSLRLALAGGVTSAFVESGGGSGVFGGGAAPQGPTAVLKMNYGALEGMVLLEPAAGSLAAWVTGGPSERYEIRENFVKARDHLEKERDFERRRAENRLKPNEPPPRASGPLEAYVRYLKGETVARIPAADADQIKKALELVGEFRFKCVLTGVVEGWTMPDEIGRARAWCTFAVRTKRHADRSLGRPNGSSIEQAAILRKAGVKFAILPPSASVGTGGIAGRDLQTLPLEAAFAIRGGLDEQTALEAITITAAEMLGVEARVGSLEAGKDADVVVLDGDPFDYRTLVDLTFVNGKLLYDRAKSPFFSHLKPKK